MSKRGDDDPKRHTSPTKRTATKRARILRKPKNPEVGYCRPPVENQFKPGQSGNPKGRPKGRKSEAKMLDEVLQRKVAIREAQGRRKITVLEAILHRFAEDSLKGNTKSAAFLLGRYAATTAIGQDAPELSADDKAVMDGFLKDFLAANGGTNTNGGQSGE
jgi:hypothetical protein